MNELWQCPNGHYVLYRILRQNDNLPGEEL